MDNNRLKTVDAVIFFLMGCALMMVVMLWILETRYIYKSTAKLEEIDKLCTSCENYGTTMRVKTIYSEGNGCFVMTEGGKPYPKDVYERLIGNTIYQNIRQMTTSQNTNLNKVECQ